MIHRINLTLIISSLHFADEDGRMESELLQIIIYSFICLDPNTNKLKEEKKQKTKQQHQFASLFQSLHTCF